MRGAFPFLLCMIAVCSVLSQTVTRPVLHTAVKLDINKMNSGSDIGVMSESELLPTGGVTGSALVAVDSSVEIPFVLVSDLDLKSRDVEKNYWYALLKVWVDVVATPGCSCVQ